MLAREHEEMIVKGLVNYRLMQYIMILNYIRYVNNPQVALNYAKQMCSIYNSMVNWAMEYARRMFGVELPYSEASKIVTAALKRVSPVPYAADVAEACAAYEQGNKDELTRRILEIMKSNFNAGGDFRRLRNSSAVLP